MASRAAYYREYRRKRRLADPAYRDRVNQRNREWRAKNPDYAKRKGAERRADPEKYEADKVRNRELLKAKRADPEYRARERARSRARMQAKRADPAYRETENARNRARRNQQKADAG